MSQNPKLIVTTLMTPQGATGVQTHFNAIISAATNLGIETGLVSPYNANVIIARKAFGLIGHLLKRLNKEWLILWTRWTHYFLLKYQLKKILQSENEKTVIYAQDPLSSRAALAVKKAHQRVVTVVHFNVAEADEVLKKGLTVDSGLLYRHLQNNEALTLPKVDKIIFVSNFMQAVVNDRLPSLKAVPQAVIANFIQDHGQPISAQEPHGDLITIGTLETRKNQAFILKVLANALARGHHYRLTVIGDGPDRAMLEQLAVELKLGNRIRFWGFQANAAQYLAGHRVYVHAALMENLPITLLEALSHGLPILAPAVGGIPDVLIDGQQGYFWPLDDVNIATDKLCMMLENAALYFQLSGQARARFESHFSDHILADAWLTAIINV